MDKSNETKKKILGMPAGTATHRLRKKLLFHYVCLAGHDTCYRCGNKIDRLDDFSIEHKKAWLYAEKPIDLFFDLDNIAFSHISCNIAAGDKNKKYESVVDRKREELRRWYTKNRVNIRKRRKEMRDAGVWS